MPSGKMLMSQAVISAGSIGFPRFGAWAKAALEPKESARTKVVIEILRIDMFHLPIALDRPGRDAVIVLARKARYRGNFVVSPRAATIWARVGCTLPASSHARLCRIAGPPFQFQGTGTG